MYSKSVGSYITTNRRLICGFLQTWNIFSTSGHKLDSPCAVEGPALTKDIKCRSLAIFVWISHRRLEVSVGITSTNRGFCLHSQIDLSTLKSAVRSCTIWVAVQREQLSQASQRGLICSRQFSMANKQTRPTCLVWYVSKQKNLSPEPECEHQLCLKLRPPCKCVKQNYDLRHPLEIS